MSEGSGTPERKRMADVRRQLLQLAGATGLAVVVIVPGAEAVTRDVSTASPLSISLKLDTVRKAAVSPDATGITSNVPDRKIAQWYNFPNFPNWNNWRNF